MDVLFRPDIQEMLNVLRLCNFLNDSQEQTLKILRYYQELRQTLPPKTKQKEIYERIQKDLVLNLDSDTIRKTVERYLVPIPPSALADYVAHHHIFP